MSLGFAIVALALTALRTCSLVTSDVWLLRHFARHREVLASLPREEQTKDRHYQEFNVRGRVFPFGVKSVQLRDMTRSRRRRRRVVGRLGRILWFYPVFCAGWLATTLLISWYSPLELAAVRVLWDVTSCLMVLNILLIVAEGLLTGNDWGLYYHRFPGSHHTSFFYSFIGVLAVALATAFGFVLYTQASHSALGDDRSGGFGSVVLRAGRVAVFSMLGEDLPPLFGAWGLVTGLVLLLMRLAVVTVLLSLGLAAITTSSGPASRQQTREPVAEPPAKTLGRALILLPLLWLARRRSATSSRRRGLTGRARDSASRAR